MKQFKKINQKKIYKSKNIIMNQNKIIFNLNNLLKNNKFPILMLQNKKSRKHKNSVQNLSGLILKKKRIP